MTETVFAAPPPVLAPIRGKTALFPVRRIFCVGQNYLAHAQEMGNDGRDPPFYFTKPSLAYVPTGATTAYPPMTANLHYEMELVIAIGAPAFRVPVSDAIAAIYGFACGLDMTRRDLQFEARTKGRPWDLGKAFEESAVLAEIIPIAETGPMEKGAIWLTVNGETKQSSDISQLIWSVPEIVSDLSRFYHLQPGDLIYSGTPAGVGPVVPGDRIEGAVEGVGSIALTIGPADPA